MSELLTVKFSCKLVGLVTDPEIFQAECSCLVVSHIEMAITEQFAVLEGRFLGSYQGNIATSLQKEAQECVTKVFAPI